MDIDQDASGSEVEEDGGEYKDEEQSDAYDDDEGQTGLPPPPPVVPLSAPKTPALKIKLNVKPSPLSTAGGVGGSGGGGKRPAREAAKKAGKRARVVAKEEEMGECGSKVEYPGGDISGSAARETQRLCSPSGGNKQRGKGFQIDSIIAQEQSQASNTQLSVIPSS